MWDSARRGLEAGGSVMVQLLLVHGVGGAKPGSDWMKPLNFRLPGLGFSTIAEPTDTICAPSYGHLFGTTEAEEPRETYKRPPDKLLLAQRLEFAARQKALERVVRPHNESTDVWGWPGVTPTLGNPLLDLVEFFGFADVRRYIERPAVRNAVWRHLLEEMPQTGSVIVVAHSLGSVAAAGLLRRLPPGVTVDLLVTIGSPLPFGRYRSHLSAVWADFPYSRALRWLNVHSPWDGVTGGRGISGAIPHAVDVCAHINGDHAIEAYMSHPAVAAAIASVAFPPVPDGGATASRDTVEVPLARRIHMSWGPLLLGAAFTWQLSRSLPSDEWRSNLRLEAARAEVARRAVADIEAQRRRRAESIEQLRDLGLSPSGDQLGDHPLADYRYPNFRDLTVGAAALLDGAWTDQELLSLAVGLMLQPLVKPFDIQASPERRCRALELTLNVVRDKRGNLADKTFAEQVRKSVVWAEDRLAAGGRFPWGTVLITSGLVLLAATGVGLAVAAPAGLAGAAVVTSTLAAFGPGGMVGGLLTLGAMTGTAGALGALGVAAELEGSPATQARAAAEAESAAAAQSGVELAAAPVDTLTVTLTGMLAVVHAQSQLDGFASTEPLVRIVLNNALDTVRAEHRIHHEVAPDTKGTNVWARKVTLLERALTGLDKLTDYPLVDALVTARKAVESATRPAILPATPERLQITDGGR